MHKFFKTAKSHLAHFWLIFGIFIFNILDAVLTIRAIKNGAHELNPVMRFFLEINFFTFFIAKLFIVSFCLCIFWKLRDNKFCRISVFFCFLIYLLLTIYHFYMLIFYF